MEFIRIRTKETPPQLRWGGSPLISERLALSGED